MSDNKTRLIGRTQHVNIPSNDNNKTMPISLDGKGFNDNNKTVPVSIDGQGLGANIPFDSGNNFNGTPNIAGTRILGDIAYVDPNEAKNDGKTKLVRPRRTPSVDIESSNLANTPVVEDDYSEVVGWVTIVSGYGRGRSFELKHGYSFVGKDASQEVCLNFGDESISKEKHIKFLYDDQDRCFYVTAGESRNLGRINGKLFDGLTPIKNYDKIKIGNTELLFIALCGEEFSW
ncbi:MAG: FHA domain-containing protein [Opitutales bacterium]